jgi:2-polyprenyl-3-methyl-5-hydroxy-6-metoxy-1,4-benzoquinol methylase
MTERNYEQSLAHSWETNAAAWTQAVREQQIESRRAGTDAAILAAVAATEPQRVLDVGCGEGWLARALSVRGMDVVGVDGSTPLIERAQAYGGGTFRVMNYAQIVDDPTVLDGSYDAVVCNFALLGQEIAPLLGALRSVLSPGGALCIQTVHPFTACSDQAYRDGWRTETFAHFGDAFREPMPWYFRTIGSWLTTLWHAGFVVTECLEPLNPASDRPLSLLLVCGVR